MRKLIATVFNYSLDGLLADEGTEFWKFVFDRPENRESDNPAHFDFLRSAHAHIMGRTTYELFSAHMPTSTDPFAAVLNAGRKVVFSRTLKTADWANTTIAAGDTTEQIDKLRLGGDGYIVVYVAGEGTRLFDGDPKSYRLELVSSSASSRGIIELQYRRHR
jgi:dihydrofolate reductase